MNTVHEYNELLKSRGVPLQAFGIADIALERADALNAVELLRKVSIPVLGGDVYFKRPNWIELAYANWHSDPQAGEDHQLFASRSCIEAKNYIKSFPSSNAVPLFALVIDTSDKQCPNPVTRPI